MFPAPEASERQQAWRRCLYGGSQQLNSKKFDFARNHVVLLGRVISRDGLQSDPCNANELKSWPTTLSEVRAFMGLSSFYRQFVKCFWERAVPLNHLADKNVPFEWSAKV